MPTDARAPGAGPGLSPGPSPGLGAWVASAGLVVLTCLGLSEDSRAPARAAPCSVVVQVDGQLRCDAGPVSLEDACGHRWWLADGDRLEPGCEPPGRIEADALAALGVVLDPNRASVADLQSWPGVGPVLAERIVAGRPYAHPDDLLAVRGIGPKTLARLRPRVSISASRP